jgi:hypothetical protein
LSDQNPSLGGHVAVALGCCAISDCLNDQVEVILKGFAGGISKSATLMVFRLQAAIAAPAQF